MLPGQACTDSPYDVREVFFSLGFLLVVIGNERDYFLSLLNSLFFGVDLLGLLPVGRKKKRSHFSSWKLPMVPRAVIVLL